jgi:uncharacterized membrane protein
MLHLPVVTTIYKTVRLFFQSFDPQSHGQGFKRVVLVEFPHPGTRAIGFVTTTLRDAATGRRILGVCVLMASMPPAGFTLFVDEKDVIDVDWPVHESFQAILSLGVTAPEVVHFSRARTAG